MDIRRIRGLMIQHDFTQQKLAEKMEISLSTLSRKLCTGGGGFTLEELEKLKRLLNMTDEEAIDIFFPKPHKKNRLVRG